MNRYEQLVSIGTEKTASTTRTAVYKRAYGDDVVYIYRPQHNKFSVRIGGERQDIPIDEVPEDAMVLHGHFAWEEQF